MSWELVSKASAKRTWFEPGPPAVTFYQHRSKLTVYVRSLDLSISSPNTSLAYTVGKNDKIKK